MREKTCTDSYIRFRKWVLLHSKRKNEKRNGRLDSYNVHICISSQFVRTQYSYKYFIWNFTVWSAFARIFETKCRETQADESTIACAQRVSDLPRTNDHDDDNPRPLKSERVAAGFDVRRRVRIGGYSGAHNGTDYVRAPCGVSIRSQRVCAQGVFLHIYGFIAMAVTAGIPVHFILW